VGGTVTLEREQDDVRNAMAGDARAFERLYRSHVARVYALAVRLVDEDWAEDLTQEVFIRAWDKLSTFGGRARFGTWLHRLAVNLILSRRGTLRNRQNRRAGGDDVVGLQAAPKLANPLVRLDLEAAVRMLPDRAREVFVLYDVEGYSHEEIAELTGVSVGTSKSQLHRARMIMREYLER
jgi:RNA polymerase sigma-70 factor (ECF subfamily)